MPLCQGCGASYDDQYSFCPYCGIEKPKPPKDNSQDKEQNKLTPYDCPICGNNRRTRKVSSVVASGINLHGLNETETELARRLQKPNKPINDSVWGCIGFGTMILIPTIMLVVTYSTNAPTFCKGVSITLLILFIALTIGYFSTKTSYKQKEIDYEKAKVIWESLYYCYRHDIVFIEGHEESEKAKYCEDACYRWGKELL